MRIQKKCGFKPKRRACEAFPFSDTTLTSLDQGATKSLKGEGKGKLTPTYGQRRWDGSPTKQ